MGDEPNREDGNVIDIAGLNKSFIGQDGSTIHAISDLDLTVHDNEFLTVLGPSGCGKTTLLKMIAGLVPSDSGSISIGGEVVDGPGPDRAMVFQDFALLPWSTVLENVAFGLTLRGAPKREREARARELIEMVGLDGFATKRPGELSGGMQQRVGLARALAVEPKVLLMDEPFSAVDEQTRRLLQEELLTIWERTNLTVVFITHSMEEAVLLGDRVVLMSPRPGRIAEIVPVPLERPRSHNVGGVERSPQYAEITARLWERLRDMHDERDRVGDATSTGQK